MRLINADKVKAESREHCKTCLLNGTKHCDKTCVINLICDRLDLQPTVELTEEAAIDKLHATGWLPKHDKELTTIPDGDLIRRDALKKEVENLVAGGAEGLKEYYENGSKSDENSWIGGVYDAWELIGDAPTVTTYETFSYEKGFQDGAYSGEMERLLGKRAKRALSIIDRLYTEGHINNMEQGVLRRVILFSEKGGAE